MYSANFNVPTEIQFEVNQFIMKIETTLMKGVQKAINWDAILRIESKYHLIREAQLPITVLAIILALK